MTFDEDHDKLTTDFDAQRLRLAVKFPNSLPRPVVNIVFFEAWHNASNSSGNLDEVLDLAYPDRPWGGTGDDQPEDEAHG